MPNLQEIKDLVELDTSESMDKDKFLLYLNFALYDLSEVYKYEKELEFNINSDDFSYTLPAELFQIVTVNITNDEKNITKQTVKEQTVLDYDRYYDRYNSSNSLKNMPHVYSRYNNKLKIRSCIYANTGYTNISKITVRYYATLPRFDYKNNTVNLDTTYPPIIEQHYHVALAYYITWKYFLNSEQDAESSKFERMYEREKLKIGNYVHSHRHSTNISRKIEITR